MKRVFLVLLVPILLGSVLALPAHAQDECLVAVEPSPGCLLTDLDDVSDGLQAAREGLDESIATGQLGLDELIATGQEGLEELIAGREGLDDLIKQLVDILNALGEEIGQGNLGTLLRRELVEPAKEQLYEGLDEGLVELFNQLDGGLAELFNELDGGRAELFGVLNEMLAEPLDDPGLFLRCLLRATRALNDDAEPDPECQ